MINRRISERSLWILFIVVLLLYEKTPPLATLSLTSTSR
jgi:hypothetical protein